jgi:hypothetical protein
MRLPKKNSKIFLAAQIVAWVSLAFLSAWAGGEESEVVLVGNLPRAVSSVTPEELSSLFMGYSRSLENGTPVAVASLSDRNPTSAGFYRDFLKKTVSQMKSHWSYMVFTGKATPPITFAQESELLEYIRKNPGTLGYVHKGTAIESPLREFKVSNP